MLARHRTDLRLAAAEARGGAIPELRVLARQMTTHLLAQIEQMTALRAPRLVRHRARGL